MMEHMNKETRKKERTTSLESYRKARPVYVSSFAYILFALPWLVGWFDDLGKILSI